MHPLARLSAPILLAVPLLAAPGAVGAGSDFAARWFETGAAAEKAGKTDEAQNAYARVLERDAHHLGALAALVRLGRAAGRTDEALDRARIFLERWRHLAEKPPELAGTERELAAFVREADPFQKRAEALRRDYVTKLLALALDRLGERAFHGARALFAEALATDPEHPDLAAGLARIRKEGGDELAVADEGGGVDWLAGVTSEWVAANDPLHANWDKAWKLETEHYEFKTNAGYQVLKTAARAMEGVQAFYRRFHEYKTKGEAIPKARVHIFKDAAEYQSRGKPPHDWAGGHWDGSTVYTYDPRGGSGGSLAGMLETLFHEASHQFTDLAGGSGVPAWLNEGMASFFEGTKLLSNGRLDWNLVVPGRLGPLVEDLRSSQPHALADVIQGQVEDYRVFYPWGWGIVFYLYNAEDEAGTLLYRSSLREYFQDYETDQHVERFVEFFVTRPKRPGVATLADFEKRFRESMLALAAEEQGTADRARLLEERGDRQVERGDLARAVELYERALERDPDHPECLWKLSLALEKTGSADRAAGTLRRFLAVTLPRENEADPFAARRAEAETRIAKLDPATKRLAELRARFHADALALSGDYAARGFPLLALRTLRGPATATPPSREARERYFAITDQSGVSLETWRLLFDERTLTGFYGGGEGDFTVESGVITASIGADGGSAGADSPRTGAGAGATRKPSGDFAFRRLFVDVEPAGDWSLEADVRVEAGGRMAGLCFGKKSDDSFHGVALLPEGFVDLAAFAGAPKTLQRVQRPLGSGWHRLRIEVAGTRLVVTLDGVPALEWEFDARASLRGDFGLLAGAGRSSFKDIRLLEYDASLPRRTAIGRRRSPAAADVDPAEPLARAAAGREAYRGEAPPELSIQEWIGEPAADGDLEKLRGWPLVLVFWTTDQERALPLLDGLVALAEKHRDVRIPILLVSNEPAEKVRAYLATRPVPLPIGIDREQATYAAYAIPKVRLPHAKLVAPDGRVVWEGNPDYQPGKGTYLDEPLAELVAKAPLAELLAAGPPLEAAEAAFRRGDLASAAAAWRPIAALDSPHASVRRAQRGLARCEAEGRARLERARALEKRKRILQAARLLGETAKALDGFEAGAAAKKAHDTLTKTKTYIDQKGLQNLLEAAERSVAAKKPDAARETLEKLLARLGPTDDPSLQERAQALLASLP